MNKNPLVSALLWFFGVSMLTGSGFLGMIAAFIAYNSKKQELQRKYRSQNQTFNRRQQNTGQVNPWQEGYQDVDFQTQSYDVSADDDEEEDKFVVFETDEAEQQAEPAETVQESEIAREGKRYLASLRLSRASIDNKTVRGKIEELEKIIESIYARLDEKPEQTTQVRDIMAKTMPLTTSVLESYGEMNIRKVQGDDFTQMEYEVIDVLDKAKAAYTKLYDNMYDGDILDVTSEISVLKTLLNQEGLLGGDFDKVLKKQTQGAGGSSETK